MRTPGHEGAQAAALAPLEEALSPGEERLSRAQQSLSGRVHLARVGGIAGRARQHEQRVIMKRP